MILIAAVVVGAISAFLVFNYVNGADDRAQGNARQVNVIKVVKDIPRGLSGREAQQQGYIDQSATISAEYKPVTAITDPSVILDKVAVAGLAKNQILVDGMFANQIESSVTFNSRLDENCGPAGATTVTPCVALTISVDQVKGVAGVIVPGDYVNILVRPASANCGESTGGDGKILSANDPARQPSTGNDNKVTICSPSRYLYQAAKVLLVDKSAVPQPGEVADANGTTTGGQSSSSTGNAGLLTLELTPQAAQLVSSLDPADFYLTLLPPKYTPQPLPQLDPFPAVLPGEDATQLTPYGPNGFPNK
jgi:Flp pilus assembly protein CpaB